MIAAVCAFLICRFCMNVVGPTLRAKRVYQGVIYYCKPSANISQNLKPTPEIHIAAQPRIS